MKLKFDKGGVVVVDVDLGGLAVTLGATVVSVEFSAIALTKLTIKTAEINFSFIAFNLFRSSFLECFFFHSFSTFISEFDLELFETPLNQ